MRWAAKARQDKLEWSILDVEQDEWERRLAALDVAAAANGFPVYRAAPQDSDKASHIELGMWNERSIVAAVVLLVVLGGMAGGLAAYSLWGRAQEGIARMEGDVASVVRLEGVRTRAEQGTSELHESVQGVEFLANAAAATVMVTHTEGSKLYVAPELRFYVQAAKGWQRSEPIAGFWGPTETLDTAHLHFVFGRRDRAVVAAAAPGAEAAYVLLHRATGVDLAPAGLVPIEIVPESFSHTQQLGDGRLRLTSPSLYRIPMQERATLLNRLLRLVLVKQLTAAAAQRSPAKAQWHPLVQALNSWLELTPTIDFAPDDEAAALHRLELRPLHSAWHLTDLQKDMLHYDLFAETAAVYIWVSDGEWQRQRRAAAEQLVDYIASTYGIDILPRLLQGFAQYKDWEELAPAVLGVSAAGLEEGWHSAKSEGDIVPPEVK